MNLKQKLKYFSKTQSQFAKDVGVTLRTVARWCSGKSRPQPLAQIIINQVLISYLRDKEDQKFIHKEAS
jgi:DNA-binding transcriptional regulator YiaG